MTLITRPKALGKVETREVVTGTVNTVFEIVTSTMGPDGNVVVYAEGTATKTTKDGATAAGCLEMDDPHAERINRIIEEAARKTEKECGDGTTTTVFLMKHFYDLLLKYPGFVSTKRIEELVHLTIEQLKKDTIELTRDDARLYDMALTTANQDDGITKNVLGIYRNKDRFPMVEIYESSGTQDKIMESQGHSIHMTLADGLFSTFGNGADTEFTDMVFAVVNRNLIMDGSLTESVILTQLRKLAKTYPNNRIGLVAPNVDSRFISLILSTNQALAESHGDKKFVVFRTSTGGSIGTAILGDVATVLGAEAVPAFADLESTTLAVCKETIVSSLNQTIIKSLNEETQLRIEERAKQIEDSLESLGAQRRYSPYGRATQKRLYALRSEIVTVYVGGETPNEIKERKDRYEDVVLAVKSALENGILPGCGTALRAAAFAVALQYEREPLIADFVKVCFEQWLYLTKDMGIYDSTIDFDQNFPAMLAYKEIVNLATTKQGTPEYLGVYDTAYASITALKGAFATAKILANTSSIMLGNKSGAVSF